MTRPIHSTAITWTARFYEDFEVRDVYQHPLGRNLGLDDLRLTAPVFTGDTIWSESIVPAKRESASRPLGLEDA